jgi:Resolvase, N terminal domain
MALAQARQIDVILVSELTRLGRSTLDLVRTLQDLEAWNVSLVAQSGLQFDLSTSQGKLIASVMAALRAQRQWRWTSQELFDPKKTLPGLNRLFFGSRQKVRQRFCRSCGWQWWDRQLRCREVRRAQSPTIYEPGRTALAIYHASGLDVVGVADYGLPAPDWSSGMPEAFLAPILLLITQSVLFFARERAFKPFPVQLRLADTLLLIICFLPPIRWLFWLPAVGTFALVIFGYCLMARMLSLLAWNRTEAITADLLRRTFLSRPRLLDRADSVSSAGCGAGLCSIEAQVELGTGQCGTTLGRSP